MGDDERRSRAGGGEPPEEAFAWTRGPATAPAQPALLRIGFEAGLPVSVDGKALAPAALIRRVGEVAGLHGVGRIDLMENRMVGIKSREVYEAPAAVTLIAESIAQVAAKIRLLEHGRAVTGIVDRARGY